MLSMDYCDDDKWWRWQTLFYRIEYDSVWPVLLFQSAIHQYYSLHWRLFMFWAVND